VDKIPQGEEAKPLNGTESHSGEVDKIPQGEEAKPLNGTESHSGVLNGGHQHA
jgi:hypothetical protein